MRLSTRSIEQVERSDDSWREGALRAATGCASPARAPRPRSSPWARSCPRRWPPGKSCARTFPGLGLLAITSPDLLHRGWTAAQAARWHRRAQAKPRRTASVAPLAPAPGLVTLADAAPASLSWLGGVLGQRVAPLGVEKFGQTGNLADLYAAYRLDGDAITEAVAELLLPA